MKKTVKSNTIFLCLYFIPVLLIINGCSLVNSKIDEKLYKNQIKVPSAIKFSVPVKGVNRDYFLIKTEKNKKNSKLNKNNNHLILLLSGSGCADEQPLLGFLYQGIPFDADIAVLQKKGVRQGTISSKKQSCSKKYHQFNSHDNRVQDNLSLLLHLKNKYSYKKVTLLGISEGVQIAYLMMINEPSINEAIFLANHAATSIKGAYDIQAKFRGKSSPNTLKRYKQMQYSLDLKKDSNVYQYGRLLRNWRITFDSDKRNMGEVLSKRENTRYLFIMGENDHLVPSENLKKTKTIFCKNKNNMNTMLYKLNADHIVLRSPRLHIHKVIADWLSLKEYQNNKHFRRLDCERH